MGQYLVAVDGDSNLLEGIPADLPSVDPQAPDAALLQELGTQIIFTRAEKGEDPLSQIKESGICVAYFPENISLNSIMEDILFLAACTKTDAAGEEIVFSMIEKMNEIKDIAKTITTPKTVYIETDGDFQTVGTRTILNEMVELAGGKNIFDDKDQAFTTTSDQIISLNPDVILTFQQASEGSDPVEQIKGREGWEAITAVTSRSGLFPDL